MSIKEVGLLYPRVRRTVGRQKAEGKGGHRVLGCARPRSRDLAPESCHSANLRASIQTLMRSLEGTASG